MLNGGAFTASQFTAHIREKEKISPIDKQTKERRKDISLPPIYLRREGSEEGGRGKKKRLKQEKDAPLGRQCYLTLLSSAFLRAPEGERKGKEFGG